MKTGAWPKQSSRRASHQRNESFTSYGHRSNHCLQSDGLHHHTSVIFAFTREDHPLIMAVLCARNGENTIYWDWIYFLQHTTWVITVQQTGTNAIHEFLPEISLRPYSVRHTILRYLLDLLQKLGSFKLSAIRHNETTEISLRRHATKVNPTPHPFFFFLSLQDLIVLNPWPKIVFGVLCCDHFFDTGNHSLVRKIYREHKQQHPVDAEHFLASINLKL